MREKLIVLIALTVALPVATGYVLLDDGRFLIGECPDTPVCVSGGDNQPLKINQAFGDNDVFDFNWTINVTEVDNKPYNFSVLANSTYPDVARNYSDNVTVILSEGTENKGGVIESCPSEPFCINTSAYPQPVTIDGSFTDESSNKNFEWLVDVKSQGTYEFFVFANSTNTNVGRAESDRINVTGYVTYPSPNVTEINTNPSSIGYEDSVDVSADVNEFNSTTQLDSVWVNIEENGNEIVSQTFMTDGDSDGIYDASDVFTADIANRDYTIEVVANNTGGGEGTNTTTRQFSDNTNPSISYLPETTNTGNLSQDWIYAKFDASDNFEIKKVEGDVDGTRYTATNETGNTEYYVNMTGLSEGLRSVKGVATDIGFNTESTFTKEYRIDTVPPSVTNLNVVEGDPDGTLYDLETVDVSAKVTDSNGLTNVTLNASDFGAGIVDLQLAEVTDSRSSLADFVVGTFKQTTAQTGTSQGDIRIGYPNGTSSDNLELFFRLDGSNPTDYSGNGVSASVGGSPNKNIEGGVTGTTMWRFTGSNDKVMDINYDFDSDWTASVWFPYPNGELEDTGDGNWRTLIRGNDGSSGVDHQIIVQSGGYDLGTYDNTGGTGFHDSGFDVNSLSNGMHHLVVRQTGGNSGTMEFYIDGQKVGEVSGYGSTSKISTLGNCGCNSQPWGELDEFRFYDTAVSDQKIKQLYLNGASGDFNGNYTSERFTETSDVEWKGLDVNATVPTSTQLYADIIIYSGGSESNRETFQISDGTNSFDFSYTGDESEVKFYGNTSDVTKSWEVHDFSVTQKSGDTYSGSFTVDAGSASDSGQYNVTVEGEDYAGNIGTASEEKDLISTPAPSISLTSPLSGETVRNPTLEYKPECFGQEKCDEAYLYLNVPSKTAEIFNYVENSDWTQGTLNDLSAVGDSLQIATVSIGELIDTSVGQDGNGNTVTVGFDTEKEGDSTVTKDGSTVKVNEAGTYIISYSSSWHSTSADGRHIMANWITKNGAEVTPSRTRCYIRLSNGEGDHCSNSGTIIVDASAGDKFALKGTKDHGTSGTTATTRSQNLMVRKTRSDVAQVYDSSGGQDYDGGTITVNMDTENKADDAFTFNSGSDSVTINEAGWYNVYYTTTMHQTNQGNREAPHAWIQNDDGTKIEESLDGYSYIRNTGNGDQNHITGRGLVYFNQGETVRLRLEKKYQQSGGTSQTIGTESWIGLEKSHTDDVVMLQEDAGGQQINGGSSSDVTFDTQHKVGSSYSHTKGDGYVEFNEPGKYVVSYSYSVDDEANNDRHRPETYLELNDNGYLTGSRNFDYTRGCCTAGRTTHLTSSVVVDVSAGDQLSLVAESNTNYFKTENDGAWLSIVPKQKLTNGTYTSDNITTNKDVVWDYEEINKSAPGDSYVNKTLEAYNGTDWNSYSDIGSVPSRNKTRFKFTIDKNGTSNNPKVNSYDIGYNQLFKGNAKAKTDLNPSNGTVNTFTTSSSLFAGTTPPKFQWWVEVNDSVGRTVLPPNETVVYSDWYDNAWEKRKKVTVSNTQSENKTNKAFQIDGFDIGSASNDSIRVLKNTESGTLEYATEKNSSGGYNIRAKDNISANTQETYWVYYDNPDASGNEVDYSSFKTFYSDGFEEDTDGTSPPSGWKDDGSAAPWLVTAGTDNYATHDGSDSYDRTQMWWNEIGQAVDPSSGAVTMYGKHRASDTSGGVGNFKPYFRESPSGVRDVRGGTNTIVYIFDANNNQLTLKYCGSGGSCDSNSGGISYSSGTDYNYKVYVNGQEIKAKFWAEGNSEPSSWDVSHTSSKTIDSPMYAGFSTENSNPRVYDVTLDGGNSVVYEVDSVGSEQTRTSEGAEVLHPKPDVSLVEPTDGADFIQSPVKFNGSAECYTNGGCSTATLFYNKTYDDDRVISSGSEWNDGTFNNTVVNGSRLEKSSETSTSQVLEGFEDGDISEYAGDTADYQVVQSPVKNGSYALEGGSSGCCVSIDRDVPADTYNTLSVYMKTKTNARTLFYLDPDGGDIGTVQIDDSTGEFDIDGTVYKSGIDADTWNKVTLKNIDYSNNNINEIYFNGEQVGTDHPFNSAKPDLGSIQWLFADGGGYADTFATETAITNYSYTSKAFDFTNNVTLNNVSTSGSGSYSLDYATNESGSFQFYEDVSSVPDGRYFKIRPELDAADSEDPYIDSVTIDVNNDNTVANWASRSSITSISNKTKFTIEDPLFFIREYPEELKWNYRVEQSNGQTAFASANYSAKIVNATLFRRDNLDAKVQGDDLFSNQVSNFRDVLQSIDNNENIFQFKEYVLDPFTESVNVTDGSISINLEPRVAVALTSQITDSASKAGFIGTRTVTSLPEFVGDATRTVDADRTTEPITIEINESMPDGILTKVRFIGSEQLNVAETFERVPGAIFTRVVTGSPAISDPLERTFVGERTADERTDTDESLIVGRFIEIGSEQLNVAETFPEPILTNVEFIGSQTLNVAEIFERVAGSGEFTRTVEETPRGNDLFTREIIAERNISSEPMNVAFDQSLGFFRENNTEKVEVQEQFAYQIIRVRLLDKENLSVNTNFERQNFEANRTVVATPRLKAISERGLTEERTITEVTRIQDDQTLGFIKDIAAEQLDVEETMVEQIIRVRLLPANKVNISENFSRAEFQGERQPVQKLDIVDSRERTYDGARTVNITPESFGSRVGVGRFFEVNDSVKGNTSVTDTYIIVEFIDEENVSAVDQFQRGLGEFGRSTLQSISGTDTSDREAKVTRTSSIAPELNDSADEKLIYIDEIQENFDSQFTLSAFADFSDNVTTRMNTVAGLGKQINVTDGVSQNIKLTDSQETSTTATERADLVVDQSVTVFQRYALGNNLVTGSFSSSTPVVTRRDGEIIYTPITDDRPLTQVIGSKVTADTSQLGLTMFIILILFGYLGLDYYRKRKIVRLYKADQMGKLSDEEKERARRYLQGRTGV